MHVAISESGLPQVGTDPKRRAASVLAVILGLGALLVLAYDLARGRSAADVPHSERPSCRTRWGLALPGSVPAVLLGLALGWPSLRSRPAEADQPILKVVPESRDVRVNAREASDPSKRWDVTYRVHNRGRETAVIDHSTSSCGCAAPTLSAHKIPPGGSIEVKVRVQPIPNTTRAFQIALHFRQPADETLTLRGTVAIQ